MAVGGQTLSVVGDTSQLQATGHEAYTRDATHHTCTPIDPFVKFALNGRQTQPRCNTAIILDPTLGFNLELFCDRYSNMV